MQDLTGTWNCADEGTYYMVQIGTNLYWNGVREGYWTNVGFGVINENDETVIVSWADPPNSFNSGNHGVVFLDASKPNYLAKRAGFGTGDFKKTS